MKVLFVGRTDNRGEMSPILISQGKSLKRKGVELDFFPLKYSGIKGYIKNIKTLSAYIRKSDFDIVHAHYSLSGFVASLSTTKPVVVSLMGSFNKKNIRLLLIHIFISLFWKTTIVKSEKSAKQLNRKSLHIIPNGVNLDLFNVISKEKAREECHLKKDKKYILFAADPKRGIKNFSLAQNACKLLNKENVELLNIYSVSHDKMVKYMMAVDVLLLTSLFEGSPNVIKEALASNLPIVTTNVGDVNWLLKGVKGAFVVDSYDPQEVTNCIQKALKYDYINGRDQIIKLELDAQSVANKLIHIYSSLI